jgi:ribonuclease HIII
MHGGQDDDSILGHLLNDLDIESAINRLKRIGFMVLSLSNKPQHYNHLHRSVNNEHEDVFIQLNLHNQFIVKYVCNGLMAVYPDIIATWDDWVAFIRLLMIKHLTQRKQLKYLS